VVTVENIAATEDGAVVTGTASFTDVDVNDAHTYTVSDMAAGEGSVSIAVDGVYTYSVGSNFQNLALDETQDVTFDVTVTDNNGGSDTKAVTVTVTGTNDAPVITTDSDSLTIEATVEENSAVAGDTLVSASATDVDTNDVITYTITSVEGDTSGTLYDYFSIDSSTGTVALTATGALAVNDSEFNNYTFDITVEATDGMATDSTTIQVQINDSTLTQPTLDLLGDNSGDITDDITNDTTPLLVMGALDDDLTSIRISENGVDLAIIARADINSNWTSVLNGNSLNYNSFTGDWTYQAATLAEGDNIFTLTVGDDGSNFSSNNYTVTIDSLSPDFQHYSRYEFITNENDLTGFDASALKDTLGQDSGTEIVYGISNEQSSLFSIDTYTGEITFNAVPNFENPQGLDIGAGPTNDYYMTVTATDVAGNSTTEDVKITVNDVETDLTFVTTTTPAGEDVYALGNVDAEINLSNVLSLSTATSVEQINITGGNHILSDINVTDVISLTDAANSLVITGSTTNTVAFDNTQWEETGLNTNIYTNINATDGVIDGGVLIQIDDVINVDI